MTKARDLANAGTALTSVSATELGYVDGVTSAIQTQIDSKEPTLPSQTGNSGKYLTTNGTTKSWGTVSQYALPSQTGNAGKFLTTNGTSESWGTVNQPITWTQRLAPIGSAIRSISYNGSNLYVAVGDSGILYTSSNGTTWTSRTSGFGTNGINKVIWVSGLSLWIAVGSQGTITTSSDGITWTARTANMGTNQIRDIYASGSTVVAVGQGGGATNTGGITYSTDGITWTRKNQSVSVGQNYYSVTYNGTNWVVACQTNSSFNTLYASTPSGTWTEVAVGGTTADLYAVIWDGTNHIFIRSTGALYRSASSTLASIQTINQFSLGTFGSDMTSWSLYNGRLYVSITGGSNINNLIDFSTTVSANSTLNFNDYGTPVSLPGANQAAQGIFVGAIGKIIATNSAIYTSF